MNEFLEFLKQLVEAQENPDFDSDCIQMRWHNEYDGSTKWHPMIFDREPFKHGFFPYQAEYRLGKCP